MRDNSWKPCRQASQVPAVSQVIPGAHHRAENPAPLRPHVGTNRVRHENKIVDQFAALQYGQASLYSGTFELSCTRKAVPGRLLNQLLDDCELTYEFCSLPDGRRSRRFAVGDRIVHTHGYTEGNIRADLGGDRPHRVLARLGTRCGEHALPGIPHCVNLSLRIATDQTACGTLTQSW